MSQLFHEPCWLGIDLGTQSVRVVVLSATGGVVGSGAAKLTSRRDDSRHEQDPNEWWSALALASRAALGGIAAEAIRGLAVDGTSGTILLVDGAGNPLTPALMYDDTRAVAEAHQVNGAGARIWSELGYSRMQAAWGLPKLLWLIRECAHPISAQTRLAHQTDFINRRLVGEPV